MMSGHIVMRAVRRLVHLGVASALVLAADGCGAGSVGVDYGHYDKTSRATAGPSMRVRWAKPLAAEFGGAYVPVERGGVAIDPVHDRLFIGSSERELWALERTGRELWKRRFDAAIDAPSPRSAARRDRAGISISPAQRRGKPAAIS